MKTFLLLTGVLLAAAAGVGAAECAYFRTSTQLLKCAAVDANKARDPDLYPSPFDAELEERNDLVLVQVDCECAYSLSGSDLRCDMDQTVERSSVIGAETASVFCRRGRSLCSDVCPSRLP